MNNKTTILDDKWNAGFDDFFRNVPYADNLLIESEQFREQWCRGWQAAGGYSRIIVRLGSLGKLKQQGSQ